jgi:hypothetical protein
MHPQPLAPAFARSALPRERVRSMIHTGPQRTGLAVAHNTTPIKDVM